MNEIEFLPKKFQEKRARNSIKWSRVLLLILIIAGLSVATLYQAVTLHRVHRHLADVDQEHEKVVGLMNEVNNKREELNRRKHQARLLAFLEHPFPKSQIIATLTNPISDQIVITQLNLTHQQTDPNAFRALSEKTDSKKAASAHPMEQDLRKLVEETRLRRCTVELTGTTDDPSALYNFLTALHQSELVETAKIESIDPQQRIDGTEFSNFTAHIKIKRGYGSAFDEVLGQVAGDPAYQDRTR